MHCSISEGEEVEESYILALQERYEIVLLKVFRLETQNMLIVLSDITYSLAVISVGFFDRGSFSGIKRQSYEIWSICAFKYAHFKYAHFHIKSLKTYWEKFRNIKIFEGILIEHAGFGIRTFFCKEARIWRSVGEFLQTVENISLFKQTLVDFYYFQHNFDSNENSSTSEKIFRKYQENRFKIMLILLRKSRISG